MSDSKSNFDGDTSMFEEKSVMHIDEDMPAKYADKIEKLEDTITKLNVSLKDKNEKILELLSEVEDIKIQVFARDKSIEL